MPPFHIKNYVRAVTIHTPNLGLKILLLTIICAREVFVEANCAAKTASVRFKPIDPNCQSAGNSTDADTSWQVTPNQLTCAWLCAQRDTCKYFNYSSGRCALSVRPQGMTHRKLDPRFSRCREVCVNSKRFCIVQERLVDSVNFSRNWVDYENGFGEPGAFWIGLRLLNLITGQSSSLIFRAEIWDWNNRMYVAEYAGFTVGDGSAKYTMNYMAFLTASSNFSGDSLALSRGMRFSTLDMDNDNWAAACSTYWHGGAGWWFDACTDVNPNGLMTAAEVVNYAKGIHWMAVHGNKNSLKSLRLLLQLPD